MASNVGKGGKEEEVSAQGKGDRDPVAIMEKLSKLPLGERLTFCTDLILKDGVNWPKLFFAWHFCIWLANFGLFLLLIAIAPQHSSEHVSRGRLIFAKFLVWQHVAEAVGCRQGPLAGHLALPNNWKFRITPGTLKCASFPSIFGTQRGFMDCFVHALFFLLCFAFLLSPDYAWHVLQLLCVCDVWIFLTDRMQFFASQGHAYWTMLFSLCFPADQGQLAGAQMALIYQWFFSGVGKVGPWFDYVNGPFIVQSRLLDIPGLRRLAVRLLFKSETDRSPSLFGKVLAQLAAAAEWGAPIALMVPVPVVEWMGLVVITAMHVYILLMPAPFDVYSWNTCFMCSGLYMFYYSGTLGFDWSGLSSMHWAIAAVLLAEFAVCSYGQFFPNQIGFYLSHRYWAGNWVWSHCFVRNTEEVKAKLGQVKTFAPNPLALPPSTERKAMVKLGKTKTLAYLWLATMNNKCVVRLAQRAFELINAKDDEMEWVVLHNFCFGEFRDVIYWEQAWPIAQKAIGFESGECVCLFLGSFGLGRKTTFWKIIDLKDGILEEGEMSLEGLMRMDGAPTQAADRSIPLAYSSAAVAAQKQPLLAA